MPRKTFKERYWEWPEEKRQEHRASVREHHAAHYVQKKRLPRVNTGNTFHQNVKNYIDSVKINLGECVDCRIPCREWNVMMFAFDHLDPSLKSFGLSKAQAQKNCCKDLIDNEIAKCELVCHNCHAYRTWAERAHLGKNVKRVEQLPLLLLMEESYENL
jgi:hypothetical protein